MKKLKNLLLLTVILTFALTSTISCGGGGGGGGGAAGPAASSETPSDNTSSTTAPVLSAEAEILTFEFKKDSNEAAFEGDSAITTDNVSSDLVGIIDSANATVVVKYPFDTLPDKSALIPEFTVSANASVSPESGATQNFSVPVTYSVTAQNGAVKQWTVTFEQLDPNEHSITYHMEGDTSGYIHSFNEGQSVTLAVRREVTKQNYCFAGWYEDENCAGSPIEGWISHEKTADVELWPKWLPAPRVDTASQTVYTNGRSVIVTSPGSQIYYDLNNDSLFDADDVNLTEIDPAHTNDFTNWNVKAGNHPDATVNPDCASLPNAKIAITGGMLQDVEASATTNVWLSGSPIIGDKNEHGIRLSTCPNNVVTIVGNITTLSDNITLIAAGSLADGDVVAKFDGGNADADKFILRNAEYNDTYNIEVRNSNIVVKGSVSLPDEPCTRGSDLNGSYFTLGGGHVSADGTIFSVFVDGTNAFFILPSTAIDGISFDMAVPYDENGAISYIDANTGSISTSTKLQYVQFKSESGSLSPRKVSEYFGNIKFYGTRVNVNVNLQTVPFADINGYTYFNGSFYKIVDNDNNKAISWTKAYNGAKKMKFNNLTGYLVTITSSVENRFIFDRLLKDYKSEFAADPTLAKSWIGASRSVNSNGGYDASEWTDSGANNARSEWYWVCGPEAGKMFYTKKTAKEGGARGGDYPYASWDNDIERALNSLPRAIDRSTGKEKNWEEPNGASELFCHYSGTYVWNDLENGGGNKKPQMYIVEFTEYGTQTAEHRPQSDKKTYSNSRP
ncbi:MAG: hypothetical protein PUF61_00235 [Spirochaetales bacterium]|nr:hypothetical protein [Spirochaetales bacterium]